MLKNIDSIDSNDALNDNLIYNYAITRSYVMTINWRRFEYYVAHPTKGDTVREAIQLAWLAVRILKNRKRKRRDRGVTNSALSFLRSLTTVQLLSNVTGMNSIVHAVPLSSTH